METVVTGDFEGGNCRLIECRRESGATLVRFAPVHKRYEPQALWFHMEIRGAVGDRIRLEMVNPQQCLGRLESWPDNRPVYRCGNGSWHRVESVALKRDEGLVQRVVFEVPANSGSVEVAFCYPYQLDDLTRCLGQSYPLIRSTIGYSAEGREIIRLATPTEIPEKKPPGVYLVARQHSGETPGSLVLDGIIRYLISDEGKEAREAVAWWIVPFADIDGVVTGCYGKDQFPKDLNRSWDASFPSRPEVDAIQSDMKLWSCSTDPYAVVDLHAPSHHEQGFYFHIPRITSPTLEPSKALAEAYRAAVPEDLRGEEAFRLTGHNTGTQPGTKLSQFAVLNYGCMGMTLETSYQGSRKNRPYLREDYRVLGRILAETVHRSAVRSVS